MQKTYNIDTQILEANKANTKVWYSFCQLNYTRDTWVKLNIEVSEYAYDEAKLICQKSEEKWIGWIPNYGEIDLERSDFYC